MNDVLSPALFDQLNKYVDTIKEGTADPESAIASGSLLLAFVTSFFEQFFRNDLARSDIAYPNDQAKEKAVEVRLTAGLTPERVQLVADFERLCEFIPDIHGEAYGGTQGLYSDFHREFLPDLLKHAQSWAQIHQPDLTARIEAAAKSYDEAMA